MSRPFVPVGQRRRRPQLCISVTGGEGLKRCKGHRIDNFPEFINEEILWEILIRLPVASLAKFKSVSKAWYAIISDPIFVRAHLQRSKQNHHRNPPTFLISPLVLLDLGPPGRFSTTIRFYRWLLDNEDKNESKAELLYGRHVTPGEFGLVCSIAHCDGLLLLPTNTKAYVLNPTTGDGISLPASKRNKGQYERCLPIGLGLDPSTAKYKVARSFYRSRHYDTEEIVKMGMEIFTINGEEGMWRETVVDPPFPVLNSQTATHVNGYLFYLIDKNNQKQPLQGLLRFSLKDETFGVTPLLPDMYPRVEDEDIFVKEFNRELCATFFCKVQQQLLIYMTRDVISPRWYCCYRINIKDQCFPMASLGSHTILLRGGNFVLCYNLETGRVEEELDMDDIRYLGPYENTMGHAWDDVYCFELISYMESLVPVTPSKTRLQAKHDQN